MELDEAIAHSARLGEWAHLATVSPTGQPYVTPVHPGWEGSTCWTMVGVDSVKAKNVGHEPRCSYHWQVGQATEFDGLMLWGTAEVFSDTDTKTRLWDGVFDYDLNAFAPGGPGDSPDTGFLAFTPTKALLLKQFGAGGREEWKA